MMSKITLEDVMVLARTIYGEARGESYQDKLAVAHVVLNRWRDATRRHDHTISATCLRYKQFSAWNEGDSNRGKVIGIMIDDVVFRVCLRAALEALDGDDFTKGATHYHTPEVSPPWARGHVPCYSNDSHLFYNTVR